MKRILFLILIGLIVQNSIANTFYVDPVNGSNSNGNGSISNPFKTFDYIINNNLIESMSYVTPYDSDDPQLITKNPGAPIKAGDTIMLYSGLHGDIHITNYINENYITVKAILDEIPIFGKLHLQAAKRWVFEGINISSEPYGYYLNDKLVFLESHNWQGPVSHININNCLVYSTNMAWTDSLSWINKASDGIIIKGDAINICNSNLLNVRFGISMRGDYINVKNNTITNFSSDGIRLLGSYDTIEGNIIENCYNVDENHDDGIQSFTTGGLTVDNNVINRNIILNYEDPNQPLLGSLQGIGCFDGPFYNWVIENNLIIVDHWHGISLYGAVDCNIINNTVIDPTPAVSPGPVWIKTEDISGYPSIGCIVKNNATNSISVTPSTIATNNVLLTSFSDYVNNFLDYTNNNYHLLSTSILVDAADNSVAPSIDLDGNIRPSGISSDIGAYEYLYPMLISENNEIAINIFPNPFTNELNITGEMNNVDIRIYNLMGEVLIAKNNLNIPSQINLHHLKSGVYMISIKDNESQKINIYKLLKD